MVWIFIKHVKLEIGNGRTGTALRWNLSLFNWTILSDLDKRIVVICAMSFHISTSKFVKYPETHGRCSKILHRYDK